MSALKRKRSEKGSAANKKQKVAESTDAKDEPAKPKEAEDNEKDVDENLMTDEEQPKKKSKAKSKSKAKGKAKSKSKAKSAKGKTKDDGSDDAEESKVEKKTETKKPSSKGKPKAKAAVTKTEGKSGANDGTVRSVMINRAPVLTLWVAVVSQRMGYSWNSGLTFGKLVAGWLAFSKGSSLGLMQKSEKSKAQREKEKGDHYEIKVFGRNMPVRDVSGEPLGISKGKPIKPAQMQSYIEKAFGDNLVYVKEAMETLAASYADANELSNAGYDLYTEFRPSVAAGTSGWGKRGKLDLDAIRAMAARQG